MDDEPERHRLQRQKSGCKNPFIPFKHGVKDDMTNFEPLQTLQERGSDQEDWNQNIDHERPDGLKKKFSVIITDKEQIIGGRTEDEAILQPIKHLSADTRGPGCCALLLSLASLLIMLLTMPLSLFLCIKVVQEYERAVIFRLGRLRQGGAKGPGIFFVLPCVDHYKKVDLRTVSFDVPPQEILSRDSVTVTVDAVIYYRVFNPIMATNNVEDYRHSTHLLGATTLRNVLGTKYLAEILSEREKIAQWMETSLDESTDPWGVKGSFPKIILQIFAKMEN